MKAPVLLKTFNHAVFASAVLTGSAPENSFQPSLLTADINFEEGSFRLEGDWHFMMVSNKHAQPGWFNCHTERINIEASIYPGSSIDLSDDDNDGAVFILEGNIKDSNNFTACSGLLVLDKLTEQHNHAGATWNISFYLYDSNNDDCEIAFKIPVAVCPADTRLN
jgi:hypothetical protein